MTYNLIIFLLSLFWLFLYMVFFLIKEGPGKRPGLLAHRIAQRVIKSKPRVKSAGRAHSIYHQPNGNNRINQTSIKQTQKHSFFSSLTINNENHIIPPIPISELTKKKKKLKKF